VRPNLAEDLPRVRGDIVAIAALSAESDRQCRGCDAAGGTLEISTTQDEENLWLRIEDTGTGMSKEATERIFNAFYTTKHYGSGIGLAVVWDTVRLHGFDIEVQSSPGEGTAFTIRIPKMHTFGPTRTRTRTG
jgi:signal transduction histidine kinase